MKYILPFTLISAFLFLGCTHKERVVVEYVEQNISIPKSFFTLKKVEDFTLDENSTKKDWQKHILELFLAHKECKKKVEILRNNYAR